MTEDSGRILIQPVVDIQWELGQESSDNFCFSNLEGL